MVKVVTFSYEDADDLRSNTFLLVDASNNAFVVDPSVDYDGVINFIDRHNIVLKGILLTHVHADHIGGVKRLINRFNIPFYVHSLDIESLTSDSLNLSRYLGHSITIDNVPEVINDGDIIQGLSEAIYVMHTPYHTKGSVIYYLKDSRLIFSGDSLFKLMVGRSDFKNSLPRNQESSLRKIMSLDDSYKVYPGHGATTNIGEERKNNPFIKNL